MVVVVDDADRENEGDLVMAAEAATPEKIAFFLAHTSGVICVAHHARAGRRARPAAHGATQHRVPAHRVHGQRRRAPRDDDRDLGGRPRRRRSPRSSTRRPGPATSRRPGHIFPLALPHRRGAEAGRPHRGRGRPGPGGRAHPGRRALRDRHRGQVRRWPGWPSSRRSPAEHGLPLISIADLIRYRRQNEMLVQRVSEARIPTATAASTRPTCTSRCSTASSTWPSCYGEVAGQRERAWCGSTRSA